jgi:hypothetical protein
MTVSQLLLAAGVTLIEPPVDIGVVLPTLSFSGGSSGLGNQHDVTYNMPANTREVTYRYDWSMEATANYDFTYGRGYIYVNGVVQYTAYVGPGSTLPGWQDSWYRDNNGIRSRSFDLALKGGDICRIVFDIATRLGGAPNHTAMSHSVTRLT